MVAKQQSIQIEKPQPLNDIKFGPGPLPLPEMTADEFKFFWLNFKEKYGCFADVDGKKQFPQDGSLEAYLTRELKNPTLNQSEIFGALSFGAFDGILHRSNKELDNAGAIALTVDTTNMLHKLLKLPEGARIAIQDGGGHGAGYNIWTNVLAKDTHTPVVVLDFGAFGDQWATDLDVEFAQKGFLGQVVRVRVADGEVPSKRDVENALNAAKIPASQKINMLFTSHETGTGAMVNADLMNEYRNWNRVDKIVSDFTSAILCQDIPGIGGEGKQVFGFGALQKVPRGPNLGLVLIPAGYDHVLQANGALPNPKYTSFTIAANGQLKVKETLFSGEDITRSLSMQDILRLNFATQHLLNKGGLETSIKKAQNSSKMVQDEIQKRINAANGNPEMIFLVSNPKNRGAFNIVLKKGSGLADITLEQLHKIRAEARKILAAENLARNIGPYPKGDPEAIFRFTTLGINTQKEAKQLIDAMYYGLYKAMDKVLGRNVNTNKVVELVAEDQFLYSKAEEVEAAISAKKASLAKQGITFIDARNQDVDYSALAGNTRYMVYKPQLLDNTITDEYKKIVNAGITDNAIIVAAKNVPPEAKFKIFVREGAGTNNIPKDQAAKDGNVVMNCPGMNSEVTSRNTLNAIAGHNHIRKFHDAAMSGAASALNLTAIYGESPKVDTNALNASVQGKITAVLGAGNIGTQTILGLLNSSAAKVRVYSRGLANVDWSQRIKLLPENIRNKLVICSSIEEAMNGANIVVNHMALVDGICGTRGIIGAKQINSMADGSQIVDAARPGIINPDALIAAHKSGKLANVTMDFDTPDKAPKDEAIGKLFSYAKSLSKDSGFLYSPHGFADTDPAVRLNMLDTALAQTAEVRTGKIRNFAGNGEIPKGLENLGQVNPDGIEALQTLFKTPNALAKALTPQQSKQEKTHVKFTLYVEIVNPNLTEKNLPGKVAQRGM